MQQPYDWRDEPKRISLSSIVLLLIFVGAAALTVYAAFRIEPWASDSPKVEVSADTGGGQVSAGDVVPIPAEAPAPSAAPAP